MEPGAGGAHVGCRCACRRDADGPAELAGTATARQLRRRDLGLPWPPGGCRRQRVRAGEDGQTDRALQSWPLAYWPDGSLKWSAHALGAERTPGQGL
ncbi:hypothetical protein, partial [Dickeya dadantii]|uniref:RIFT barrel domain-containing protein n=1 Tax=Dickeya dadantii TaxID=204038 RepID=UPI00345A8B62